MGTSYTKPALTFEQQLELLEQRGLKVADRDAALSALSRTSYYRLSAYWYPLRVASGNPRALEREDAFVRGATFETALRLYEFDRRLRLLVLDGLERAEVLARTRITYVLAHASDPFAHTNKRNFDAKFDHAKWYEGVVKEVSRSREDFLEHFRRKYDDYPHVPIWMASEVMSFGGLSWMFEGMQRVQQVSVAEVFGVNWRVVQSWLHSLAYVRNVCAHHARLWNRDLAIKPLVPSGKPEWGPVKNDNVYAILCILRHLTMPCHGGDAWAESARALLRETDGAERQWERAMMGVPSAWATHVFWRCPPAAVTPGA